MSTSHHILVIGAASVDAKGRAQSLARSGSALAGWDRMQCHKHEPLTIRQGLELVHYLSHTVNW